jgi:L-glyceraldehyde 3-phosphate reductase
LTNRFLTERAKEPLAGGAEADKRLPVIRALGVIAEKRRQPLAEMALAWVLRLPAVTSALIGASSVTQLEANVRVLNHLEFSPGELAEIDRILGGA